MRVLCTKQLDFLDNLKGMKLEDISRPAVSSETVDETVRSIETSVERLADAGEADEEIRRVVTGNTNGPLNSFEEPTRQFSANSSATPSNQFSFDNLRFGK